MHGMHPLTARKAPPGTRPQVPALPLPQTFTTSGKSRGVAWDGSTRLQPQPPRPPRRLLHIQTHHCQPADRAKKSLTQLATCAGTGVHRLTTLASR